MSLMNYGFTKGNKQKDEDCEVVFEKSIERNSPVGGKEKMDKNSESKSPLKQDKPKMNNSLDNSMQNKLNISNSSKADSSKKETPKSNKTTPKKIPQSTTPKSSKTTKDNANKAKKDDLMEVEVECSPSKPKPGDLSLPYQKIKMIMKSSPEVDFIHQETVHVMTKATELFIEHLAKESCKPSANLLDYECLSDIVHSNDNFEFLKETIPKKITWEECQKLMASKET